MKKIFISSDHAGFKLKEAVKSYLSKKKLSFTDMGPHNEDRVDYPDFAHKVARRVKLKKNNFGNYAPILAGAISKAIIISITSK